MATIRKSNLKGKKRWLGRSTSRQETSFKGSKVNKVNKVNEHTTLPPLSKPTPGFLSRQKRSSASFSPRNNSSVVSNTPPSPRVNQRVSNKRQRSRNQKAIPVMPDGSKVPMWLMRFHSFHRHTSVATFLLVSATLVVYGWTVYSQHLWSGYYKKLQDLQRDERQLTKHDETLKNQLAQEAEKPHSGLVSPTPANTIFLEETVPSDSQQVDKEHDVEELPSLDAVGY